MVGKCCTSTACACTEGACLGSACCKTCETASACCKTRETASSCCREAEAPNVVARSGEKWISEESTFEGLGFAQSFRITEQLFSEQTQYQKLEVYSTENFGNLMVLDGVFQNTEVDEFTYHEMQAHVPLFSHPDPKRVLIIGGGDGGVAREVLKHKCVQEVHLVDIDKRVTDVAREFFPKIAASLDDPRLTILHQDGAKFVADTKWTNHFDVICIDSSDPIGPNAVLFREPFYRDVWRCLSEHGVAVAQGECMWLHPKTIQSVLAMNSKIFKRVDYYWHLIPVYPCGVMGLISLSKGDIEMHNIHPSRLAACEELTQDNTMYYNKDIHSSAFVKPNFFRKKMSILRNNVEDDK